MSTGLTNPRTGQQEGFAGLAGVPLLPCDTPKQTKKDFTSAAEVRWCPGCGDYAILAAFQAFLPELGVSRDNIVCVSGIGCSSRLPYYLDTYGMHSIHGRAPAIATGLATSRADLSVWVVTGDGDALSIGGNHLIHTLRRNVNLKILLFNNRIYGLTKGQYSPTSEQGKVTKSSPMGSVDIPFNPVSLALGAGGSFVARVLDSDRAMLTSVLRQAAQHRGTSFVEIYQNCSIFNDGAYGVVKDKVEGSGRLLRLEHGQPLRTASRGVVRGADGCLEVVDLADLGPEGESRLVVHDAHASDPSLAFALSRLEDAEMSTVPVGVFRSVEYPSYDDMVRTQISTAVDAAGGPATDEDLLAMLSGGDTWTVG